MRDNIRVLVACEESQAVTTAARRRGIEAYSCDLMECSGGHPEWHIHGDVLPLLNGRCSFTTMDGVVHEIEGRWDAILFFPPCTFLTNTGNRWFNVERYGAKAVERHENRKKAAEFFMAGWNADCDRVVIENPIGYMSTYFRKPDQIIHPYYFAKTEDDENCERKATGLWFRGVLPLEYTVKFRPRVIEYKNGKGTDSPWHVNTMKLPPDERSRVRSKTYSGVAEAMVDQWLVRGDESEA